MGADVTAPAGIVTGTNAGGAAGRDADAPLKVAGADAGVADGG